MSTPGFDRSGHLTELALNRLDQDTRASDPNFFTLAEAHVASCARCDAILAERRSFDSQVALRPPQPLIDRAVAVDRAARARRTRSLLVGAGVVAMAAGAFFALRPPAPDVVDPEDLRVKGAPFQLQVRVHDGREARIVGDGDMIEAGERAGFGVRSVSDGWLVVFGWDATLEPYAVWPVGDAATVRAKPLAHSDALTQLPAAIRFDTAPGDEHLAAVFCAEPFALAEVTGAVVKSGTTTRAGCVARTLVLRRAR